MRGVLVAVLAAGLAVAVVSTAILASAASLLGVAGGTPSASSAATAKIPAAMLTLYQQAAETCPGLPWTILAAIGTIESDNGQSNLPGVHGGANAAGAEGPLQFEPATFAKGSTRDWFADLRFQIAWRSPGVLTSCSAVLSRSAAPAHRGRVQMDDSPQVLGRAADQTSC